MRIKLLTSLVSFVLLLTANSASAILFTVDFEADSEGLVPNNFVSAGTTGISFSDTVGEELYVFDAGTQGSGNRSLFVVGDQDGSLLNITLDSLVDFISLDFGNDDPNYTNAGDLAMLNLYYGDTQVGQQTLALNRDDIMNQTISFGSIGGGISFDNVMFGYVNQYLEPFTGGGATTVGSIEVVDNIIFNTSQVYSIPEPSTIVLFLVGLVGLVNLKKLHK
jgi:hypothetical protein